MLTQAPDGTSEIQSTRQEEHDASLEEERVRLEEEEREKRRKAEAQKRAKEAAAAAAAAEAEAERKKRNEALAKRSSTLPMCVFFQVCHTTAAL